MVLITKLSAIRGVLTDGSFTCNPLYYRIIVVRLSPRERHHTTPYLKFSGTGLFWMKGTPLRILKLMCLLECVAYLQVCVKVWCVAYPQVHADVALSYIFGSNNFTRCSHAMLKLGICLTGIKNLVIQGINH